MAQRKNGNAGSSIPAQVAEKLAGKSFLTFNAFREAFWKAVAATPELAKQFNLANQQRMRKGKAPFAPKPEAGGRKSVLNCITTLKLPRVDLCMTCQP